jgi:hypothetical protein
MRPQVAVVVAAADVVARNQKTDVIKKRRSFLRLFHYNGLLHHYTLRAATNSIAIHKPSAGCGGRLHLHMDHTAIGIQHRFMHHFGQCRMWEHGVH